MIHPLIFTLWIALIAMLGGRFLLERFGLLKHSLLESLGFGFATGFGLIAYFIYFLGLRGFLRPTWITGLLTCVSICCLPVIPLFYRELTAKLKTVLSGRKLRDGVAPIILTVLAVFALLLASLPPTAHDALAYQLYLPKRFALAGGLDYFPSLVNSLFPFLLQMHYTAGLILSTAEAAGVFHCMTGLATVLGVFALARQKLGPSGGWSAAFILLLTPAVFIQMVIPYNDVALMCFSFFAMYACLHALESTDTDLRRKWMMAAGMFAGFALSVKYLALISIGIIGLVYLVTAFLRRDTRRMLVDLMLFSAAAALFSFLWYLRAFLIEGNPVYPYFPSIFSTDSGHAYDFAKQGVGKGLFDLILAPVRMTLIPENFGGTWARTGMAYLVFMPAGLWGIKKDRSLRVVALFSGLFFVCWFFLVQNVRFLLPILPFWAVLAAAGAVGRGRWLALILLIHGAAFVYHGHDAANYFTGIESRDQYLSRAERTYDFSRWVNQNVDSHSKTLNLGDIRMFYFDPPMVRDKELRKRSHYDTQSVDTAEVVNFLRAEGITHIFYNENSSGKRIHPPLSVPGLMEDERFRSNHLEKLHEMNAREGYRYSLYRLRDPVTESPETDAPLYKKVYQPITGLLPGVD